MSAAKISFFPRIILLVLCGLWLAHPTAAQTLTTVLATPGELLAKGVGIRCRQHKTPSASLEIKLIIEGVTPLGEYRHVECVVLKNEVPPDQFTAVDASLNAPEVVARRNISEKPDTVFLILGKELSRSYLAIEFQERSQKGTATVHRYLMSVAAVNALKAKVQSEATSEP